MIKILIAENIPSLNKGEMAILYGMLETFKVLGDVHVMMFSENTEIDRERYKDKIEIIDLSKSLHIPVIIKSRFSRVMVSVWVAIQHLLFLFFYKILGHHILFLFRQHIWRSYVEADVVVVGHDGTFGFGGGLGVPFYLMPLYIPLLCKCVGKQVVLYGGSIGRPVRFKKIQNIIMRYVLNRLDLITLREHCSYENLKASGARTNHVHVLTDPAYLLPPVDSQKALSILAEHGISLGQKPLIGFTVTREIASRACPDLIEKEKRYRYHTDTMATLVDNLIAQIGATVIFLPHCIGLARELDDRLVSADIFNRCQNKEKIRVITREYSAAELKALIGNCDLFIGERLHSVIGAISMGVPALAISYGSDQRLKIIEGVFKEEKLVCKVEDINESSLLARILALWENRVVISQKLQMKGGTLKQKAIMNGELLREVLVNKRLQKGGK